MTAPATLHRSHDARRLERPRLRELRPPPSDASQPPRAARKRPHRDVNRSMLVRVREAAGEVTGVQPASPEAATLACDALRLFRAFIRELGGPASPIVRSLALGYALQHVAGARLTLAAAEAGLATDEGARLLERAAKAQGRAERSAVAAATFAGILSPRDRTPGAPPAPWLEPPPEAP